MLNEKGLSFLGMMFLVIFFAVAGSIVLATLESTISNQAMDETIKKMDRIIVAIADYNTDVGANPNSINDLISDVATVGACTANTTTSKLDDWCGPYLDQVIQEDSSDYLTDGWGTAFEYVNTGTLRSWGPNKTDDSGGSDDITRSF